MGGSLLIHERLDAGHAGGDAGLHHGQGAQQVGGLAMAAHVDRIIEAAAGDGLRNPHGVHDARGDKMADQQGDRDRRDQTASDGEPAVADLRIDQFTRTPPIAETVVGETFDDTLETLLHRQGQAVIGGEPRQYHRDFLPERLCLCAAARRHRAFDHHIEIAEDVGRNARGWGAGRGELREFQLCRTQVADSHEAVVVDVQGERAEAALRDLIEGGQQTETSVSARQPAMIFERIVMRAGLSSLRR